VFHELTPDLYSATSRTFVGQVYRLLGLRNVADAADTAGSGYPQLSAEAVIAANPSVIVLADSKCCSQTPGTVAARPGWSSIAAVRNRRVVAVDDDIASRWGPRIATFIRVVANAIARR
jgi:iron complex transport system substrate-binding protein